MTMLPDTDHVAPDAVRAWRRHLGEEVEVRSLRAGLTEGTLPRAFHDAAARNPERPALTIDSEGITHGDLDRLAARIGGWLGAQGVEPGDRVLLCGDNSIGFVAAYLGTLRAQAVVVPAGTGSTEHELRHLVEDSGATCALAQGEALEHLVSLARSDASLRLVVALGEGDQVDAPSIKEAVSAGEPLEPAEADGGETALLAYTSGTTGRPKGVPLTHANLLSSIRAAMRAWRWSEREVLVHALPFSHQHGLGGVHATLLAGSRAVLYSRFDPAELCATIESEGATVLFAVPAMYEKLTAWDDARDADFSSLRLAVCGSSALSPSLGREASGLLGQDLLERYGSTESGLSVSNPYDGERRPGSVGLPLPGAELAIVDDEGALVAPGEDGEVVLRGPQVFDGYWHLPDATDEGFYPGGWFRTGDIGHVDPEDGYLSITGRSKEMIITGGLNVYPREVEMLLEEHRTVQAAAVVGVPSESWGEEVVAFVVPAGKDGLDEKALLAHTRKRLSAYKSPKRFIAVEKLPRNEMGKVLKDELIETVGEEHG